MINDEELIALPAHLVDHNYFLPVEYQDYILVHEKVKLEEVKEEIVVVDVSETYTLIPGVHNRSRFYVDNLGFKYYKREVRGGRVYLVCERQKMRNEFCPCTAIVSTDLGDNRIHLRNRHDHQPREIDLHMPFLREAIGQSGIDQSITSTFVRTLYNNESIRYPEAALNYTIAQAQERVKKMKHRKFAQHSLKIG